MGGLINKMPVTGTTGLVGSMSIAGVPPFSGFWSKLLIIIAAVQAGRFGYAFWAVLVSILTLAMYVKVIKYAFLGKLNEKWNKIREVPFFMKLSMIILAFICVTGGILIISEVRGVFLDRASGVIADGVNYASLVFKNMQ